MNLSEALTFWGCVGLFIGTCGLLGAWLSDKKIACWGMTFGCSLVAIAAGSVALH